MPSIAQYKSQTFNTSNNTVKFDILIELVEQNVQQATSTVNVYIFAWRTNKGYETYGTGKAYATIDGVNISQIIRPTQKIVYGDENSYNCCLLISQQIIKHDDEGNKRLTVPAGFSIDDIGLSGYNSSFYVDLPQIIRSGTVSMASNEIVIKPNSTATIEVANIEAGDTFEVGWIDPEDPYATKHLIELKNPTYTQNIHSGTWDTTDLLADITESPSKALKLYCDTNRSGTYIGTNYFEFTASISEADYKPVINVSLSPLNDDSIPSTFAEEYIINISKISIDFTESAAKEYASISEYGYVLYDESNNIISAKSFPSITDNKIVTDIITSKISKVKAYIKDTRQYVSENEIEIEFNDYAPPFVSPYTGEIKPLAYRCNAQGTLDKRGEYLYVACGKAFSSVNNKNTCKLECSINGTNYSMLLNFNSGINDYSQLVPDISILETDAYTVTLRVTDKLGAVSYYKIPIAKAFTTVKFGEDGTAISFGTEDTEDGVIIIKDFDVDIKIDDETNPPKIKINGNELRYPTALATSGGLTFKKFNDNSYDAEGILELTVSSAGANEGYMNGTLPSIPNDWSGLLYASASYDMSLVIDDYTNGRQVILGSPTIANENGIISISIYYTNHGNALNNGQEIKINTTIRFIT